VVEDFPSYPSIDHCQENVWKPAPSPLRLNPEGDLGNQLSQLPPATLCDEEDFTRFDFSYKSFFGVNIALPESDSDDKFCKRHNLYDRHSGAHSIYSADNVHLSAEQQEGNVPDCNHQRRRETTASRCGTQQ